MKQICIDNINQLRELFFQTSEVGRGENAKEYEFRMKQTILENQRRREERENEMKMLQIIMGYPPEANTQATHLNVHATSDLQYPVHPYISPSSVYESHSSISGDSSHHSSSYFEL